jgi:hypothetical protein
MKIGGASGGADFLVEARKRPRMAGSSKTDRRTCTKREQTTTWTPKPDPLPCPVDHRSRVTPRYRFRMPFPDSGTGSGFVEGQFLISGSENDSSHCTALKIEKGSRGTEPLSYNGIFWITEQFKSGRAPSPTPRTGITSRRFFSRTVCSSRLRARSCTA